MSPYSILHTINGQNVLTIDLKYQTYYRVRDKQIVILFSDLGTSILFQFFWYNYTVPICYLYAIDLLFFPLYVKKNPLPFIFA